MSVEPNTVVYLLKNCPLDTTYDHTIYFSDINSQTNYFKSLAKYTLTKLTYQRVNKGKLRVQYKADDIYDCNYIMFQNTSYGNKWFYAYIESVEYVNDITSEITYSIDVMQTWFFDYTLGECFIDREHSETDIIGDNTIPENIELGPYQDTATNTITGSDMHIYLFSTERSKVGNMQPPAKYGNVPIPCYVFETLNTAEGISQMNAVIAGLVEDGKENAIITIFAAPSELLNPATAGAGMTVTFPDRTLPFQPKNKKLYTYPYCTATITTGSNTQILRYELFNTSPSAVINAAFGANPQIVATPVNYAGQYKATEYQLTLNDWPLLPWTVDSWQSFIGRNKSKIVSAAIGGVALLATAAIAAPLLPAAGAIGSALIPAGAAGSSAISAGSVIAGGIAAGKLASSSANTVANAIQAVTEAKIAPDTMYGNAMAGDTNAWVGLAGFKLNCRTITNEYEHIIDDYFTMYGYKTNRLKVPNRNVRPHWTFTKTIGCVISGSIPCNDMEKICEIYNNGITFWNNPSEIGNYSLDNSI